MTGNYDVVIVGAGICGAILAKELGRKGKRVRFYLWNCNA